MVDIQINDRVELLPGWSEAPLLDLVKINPSYRLTAGKEYNFVPMEAVSPNLGGIILPQRKVFERQSGAKFKCEDTLFAKITPCIENGKITFVNGKEGEIGFGSTEFLVFSPIKIKIQPKYLYRLLTTHKLHSLAVSRMEGTTGRQRVPKDAFKGVIIPLPPLPEQRKIAEILTAVDDAIVKTDVIIKETQELKKGLTQKLFTEGIGHTRFKDTKIGRIPESWEVKRLKDVVKKEKPITYGIVQAGPHIPTGLPYIRSGDLNSNKLNIHNLLRTSDEIAQKYTRSEVNPGDIVFSLRGNIGETTIVPAELKRANLTQGTARISCSNEVNSIFVNYSFQSMIVKNRILAVVKGSTFVEITLKDLRMLCVPLPPLPEQQEIASILSEIDTRIENEQSTKAELEQLKRGLSQVLLTGKVRVKM